ncbi:MAG: hypothetical protein WAP35_06970 [Solirubrobacterales bacterium]
MINYKAINKFHVYGDTEKIPPSHTITRQRDLSYRFHAHFHPYVGDLMRRLLRESTAGLQAMDTEYRKLPDGSFELLDDGKFKPELYAPLFSTTQYKPTDLVATPYPVNELDFGSSGAYAIYNWELFFHVPITIAVHLSKNGRYEESQRWFHFLFDPTDDTDGPTPERFWKVRPFQSTEAKLIEEILVNLSTGADPDLRNETIRSIEAWKDSPFRPHVVARYRQQAYMYKVVMSYLDNQIAWGDSLFRQDTGEAIDEAMTHYVLAANILGPRPMASPRKGSTRAQTYASLRDDLDKFGNAMRELEAEAPFDLFPFPVGGSAEDGSLATLRSLGNALYFCVPPNDKLIGYWDTVADRLFKIRNSLNIQGTFRRLALFDPPIDPAMLARATASGLDVGAVVSGVNQPLPLVRFPTLVQKASEICNEVKSLGTSLLSAIEKEDGETLAILRAKHERVMLEMGEQVRYAQLQEATKSKEALMQSLLSGVDRFAYYESQLGKSASEIDTAIPELDGLDKESLASFKFKSGEPVIETRETRPDIVPVLGAATGPIISSHELSELASMNLAAGLTAGSGLLSMLAGALRLIPEIGGQITPWGVGLSTTIGGAAFAGMAQIGSEGMRTAAGVASHYSALAAKSGSFARREQEWAYQSNLAANEISQTFKQLRAAQIREAVAEYELRNHRRQIENSKEVEHFLNGEGTDKTGKQANKALYTWMKREVRALHGHAFQFAFDTARKAERALQHELGDPGVSVLQYGYMAGKEGLLAGEKLLLDIKRMEMEFHDRRQREYELTKNVSLQQIDPLALMQLRTTGRCTVRLPEAVFDMDGPGHYFRRVKSVAVSVPCVAGPYASVNCTLTLLKSSIRKSPVLTDGEYARQSSEDDRFDDYFGSLQSIVTSGGQNDSGMFETNLRDDRYLPFENCGAVSEWQLELPADPSKGEIAQFDYDTISDVLLHLRYTAREGGGVLKKGAQRSLGEAFDDAQAVGSVRLFSLRHDFPSEWARFQNHTPGTDERFELALTLRPEHFPFWCDPDNSSVRRVDILARSNKASPPAGLDVYDLVDETDSSALTDRLTKEETLGNIYRGPLENIALPSAPTGDIKLYFEDRALDDLWIAVTWGSD